MDGSQVCQPQPGFLGTFDEHIKAVYLTILWPLIFAAVNALHQNVRISAPFFYSVIIIHSVATLFTFVTFLFNHDLEGTPDKSQALLDTAITVVVMTAISVTASIMVYYKKIMLFEPEANTNADNGNITKE